MEKIYKYVRWLSLDIAVGAIFFLAYLEQYYQCDLPWSVYFALASAIWLIYTSDHLIDAWKVQKPSNDRHRFHRDHFRSLILVAGVVLILSLLNIHYLPIAIIKVGAMLSAVCVAYLMLVYFFKKLWVKEILVAVVYATGIFLGPLTIKGQILAQDLLLLGELSVIAFLNLIVFSYYDAARDERDGFNSIVLRLGSKYSKMLIHSTALAIIGFSGSLAIVEGASIHLLYTCMGITLYSVYLLPGVYMTEDRFRTVGDGVFYLPAVFMLLHLYY